MMFSDGNLSNVDRLMPRDSGLVRQMSEPAKKWQRLGQSDGCTTSTAVAEQNGTPPRVPPSSSVPDCNRNKPRSSSVAVARVSGN